jgi:DNA-binding transcriptional MerR regulator
MYTRDELLDAAHISARTLGTYTAMGLVPRPRLAGKNTRYTEEHLTILLAIGRLRVDGNVPLKKLARRLDAMTPDEMESFAGRGAPDPAPETAASTLAPPSGATATALVGRPCTRYELAPGLELRVDADAPDAARLLAADILRRLAAET